MKSDNTTRLVLIALLVFISIMFFRMIHDMVMSLFMAAILAGLFNGLYRRLAAIFGRRRALAAVITELILVVAILLPLGAMTGLITAQAIKVSNTVGPWIRENLSEPDELTRRLQSLPFYDNIEPYRETILNKAGAVAGSVSGWLVNALGDATMGTVHFVFHFFVMLYALYFFLIHGRAVLDKILWYLPLEDREEQRMLSKFLSVTRATLKGTLMIGFLQGALGGLAFLVAGVHGWAFWAAVMVVLSVIPGLGTALVWIPAVVWMAMDGRWGMAIGQTLFFMLVVSTVDNFIRPRVVGRDTQMPDLLVFLSTLGGLTLFGAVGFVIGPIVGALFVTVWEIYGETFKDVLPEVGASRRRRDV
jgi:predicted PurR-regulated permease PerM